MERGSQALDKQEEGATKLRARPLRDLLELRLMSHSNAAIRCSHQSLPSGAAGDEVSRSSSVIST